VASKDLPSVTRDGVTLKIITGEAFGLTSPVKVFSPIFYVDAQFAPGSSFEVTAEHEQRAVFVVGGEVEVAGASHGDGTMAILQPGEATRITAKGEARAMLLGGAALDGQRHLWWNFVASSRDRIERAKADWKEGRFGRIPGDEIEFIPLPE
jgi:redox-sensitive bicupin YhaK (pirin superfamily)